MTSIRKMNKALSWSYLFHLILVTLSLFTITSLSACLLLASISHAQWAATYGGSGLEMSGPIRQTSDGGYIAVGETFSFGAGGGDFWILKLNSSGNIQWQKTYGGGGRDREADAF